MAFQNMKLVFKKCGFIVTIYSKYRVQLLLSTRIYSFTTAPAASNSNPVNITFVADLEISSLLNSNGAAQTIKGLNQIAANTNFFVHNGDISYADDGLLILPITSYESAWNTFQNNMQNIKAQNIYVTGPGNHEVICSQAGDSNCAGNPARNFSAYLNRFRMPDNESGGYQKNASANRANVSWIIVTGHRPFYSSVPGTGPGNCSACVSAFIPYIIQYNVDLYICGHVHWCERLYLINANGIAVANNYTNTSGFIHITNGAGGAAEGAASIGSKISASAKIVTGYGYLQVQIINASNAVLNFFS